MLKWHCRNCDETLEAPGSLSGQQLHCPNCGLTSTVPVIQEATNTIFDEQPVEVSPVTKTGSNRRWIIVSIVGIVILLLFAAVTNLGIGNGSITGSVFINRRSNESLIVRGHQVLLVKPTIEQSMVSKVIRSSKAIINNSVYEGISFNYTDNYVGQKEADWTFVKITLAVLDGYSDEPGEIITNSILRLIDASMAIAKWHTKYAAVEDISSELEHEYYLLGNEYLAITQHVLIAKVKTNVDGRYSFDDVAPGDYVVVSSIGSNSFNIYWREPVTVSWWKTHNLDLFNDNASRIVNN